MSITFGENNSVIISNKELLGGKIVDEKILQFLLLLIVNEVATMNDSKFGCVSNTTWFTLVFLIICDLLNNFYIVEIKI